jgi:DNA-binding transcriptional MerR regulator
MVMSMLRTIQHAATEIGVSVGTLRDWEREGLIRPVRNSAGHRHFDDQLIARGRIVREEKARRRGFATRDQKAAAGVADG